MEFIVLLSTQSMQDRRPGLSSASHATGFNFKRCTLPLKQLLLSQSVSKLVTSVVWEAEAGRWQI